MSTTTAMTSIHDSPILSAFKMDFEFSVMDEVYTRHLDLINGMRELYATLIEMRYLREDEVIYPPYGVDGKPSVATSQLEAAGFVPEVIALMQLLPYPSNEALDRWGQQDEGVPIAPDSGAMSYLEGHEWDETIETSRQPLRGGDTGLPAWVFKLTFCGRDWGTEYIYDTRDGMMRRWDSKAESSDYWGQPSRGTTMGMNILRNELRTLDWIPWRDELGHFRTLNVHTRPSLLHSVGAFNRFEETDGEIEIMQKERAKLRQRIEEARKTNPALDAAVMKGRKRSGSIGLQEMKQLAALHVLEVEEEDTTTPVRVPEGWGIGWVLDGIEKQAPDNQELRQKILSMRHASAQELRQAAIEFGVKLPEVPSPPPPPPAPPTQSDIKLEVAKAVQNIFSCKRELFTSCGWGKQFRSDEFERKRVEFEEEFLSFFSLLGPRGQSIHDPEEGAWLREWYRKRAGDRGV